MLQEGGSGGLPREGLKERGREREREGRREGWREGERGGGLVARRYPPYARDQV